MESKEPKMIKALHLYYVIAIALIIIIVLILFIPSCVSRYAFDNFSFASTITSIVLAVVSIVYSIQSGNASSGQLGEVRDIEQTISSQLESFSDIEGKLKKTIEDVNLGVSEVKNGQADVQSSIEKFMSQVNTSSSGEVEEKTSFIEQNSLIGNILLYICALSYQTKRPLPGNIIAKMNDNYSYCYGYLVALSVFEESKIETDSKVTTNPLYSVVIAYDNTIFGTAEALKAKIERDFASKENISDLKSILLELEQYFDIKQDSVEK